MDVLDLGTVDHIDSFDVHATQSNDHFEGGCQFIPPLEAQDEALVHGGGFALEGFLIGDFNNISWSDIVQEILFAPDGFLLDLLLDHLLQVLPEVAGLPQGGDLSRGHYLRVAPNGHSGFTMLAVRLLSCDPVGVIGSLVEQGFPTLVPQHNRLAQPQGQALRFLQYQFTQHFNI